MGQKPHLDQEFQVLERRLVLAKTCFDNFQNEAGIEFLIFETRAVFESIALEPQICAPRDKDRDDRGKPRHESNHNRYPPDSSGRTHIRVPSALYVARFAL